MKAIEVKEGTWHYWLAKTFGWKARRQEEVWVLRDGKRVLESYTWVANDFCSYVRRVLFGLFVMSVCSLAISGVLYCIGAFIVYLWHWLYDHNALMSKAANIGAGISVIITGVVAVTGTMALCEHYSLKSRWDDWSAERYNRRKLEKLKRQEQSDSFLKHAYVTLKDRVCFKIKVTK